MPVFSVIFIAVLILDAFLYNSVVTNGENEMQEVGAARLSWIQQSLERYVTITDIFSAKIEQKDGAKLPSQSEMVSFVSMDNALRSLQIIADDGRYLGYNQDPDILYFDKNLPRGVKKALAETDKTGDVTVTPCVDVGNNLKDILVVHPVYSHPNSGKRQRWGYVVAVIDTDLFLQDANVTSLREQGIASGLFHTEEDGTVTSIYEDGPYTKSPVKISRKIYGDLWNLYVRPMDYWMNPWILVVTTRAGILTALALAHAMRRNSRLRKISSTDPLTGVYNRNGGDRAVNSYLQDHGDKQADVMAVDIDNFKIINDVYGHAAGDEALQTFTKRMKEIFGKHITITRNGGDEFIIFCPLTYGEDIRSAMTRFTHEPHTFVHEGKEISFYASLGCARYPDQGRDYRSLCIKADYALYGAKLNGKAGWKQFADGQKETEERTQLGFNLTDIGNSMPGALLVYRADDTKQILYVSRYLVQLMECGSLEEFQVYTRSQAGRIFAPDVAKQVHESIEEQLANPKNIHKAFFLTAPIRTLQGHNRVIDAIGRHTHNPYYGELFYIFLYDENDRHYGKKIDEKRPKWWGVSAWTGKNSME